MTDETISIDLDDLELGEVEEFEEVMGAPVGEVNLTSAKAAIHLVWMIKRRTDPNYTLDDARKVKLSQLKGDEDPPTPANGASKPAGSGRRKSGSKQA